MLWFLAALAIGFFTFRFSLFVLHYKSFSLFFLHSNKQIREDGEHATCGDAR